MKVPFSYLDRQFKDVDAYLSDVKRFVQTGDFTLGKELFKFEAAFSRYAQIPHAIGVASGTDALMLSMRLLGIGPGDEVITCPTTFIATVGAIAMMGAKPVFVDSEDGFVIDANQIKRAITPKTKAILPVHYTGNVADMPRIQAIAKKYGLWVIEDACQSIGATINGKPVGSFGEMACFSLHPLKNLNVWSDGGVIATRSTSHDKRLRLLRNHGLVHRDQVHSFGLNSRLDTLQAVIGNRLIREVEWITEKRIEYAKQYDEALMDCAPIVRVPIRRSGVKHVFHLYMIRCQQRDQLLIFLNQKGIEAKIHYPIPVHLQKAAKGLGYKKGDFPVSESDAKHILTLPVHQHLTQKEVDYVIDQVRNFCRGRR